MCVIIKKKKKNNAKKQYDIKKVLILLKYK